MSFSTSRHLDPFGSTPDEKDPAPKGISAGGYLLSPSCFQRRTPLVGLALLDERYADKAYVVRFGEKRKRNAEPLLSVQIGSVLRQALFWAAVASVLH